MVLSSESNLDCFTIAEILFGIIVFDGMLYLCNVRLYLRPGNWGPGTGG